MITTHFMTHTSEKLIFNESDCSARNLELSVHGVKPTCKPFTNDSVNGFLKIQVSDTDVVIMQYGKISESQAFEFIIALM